MTDSAILKFLIIEVELETELNLSLIDIPGIRNLNRVYQFGKPEFIVVGVKLA